MKGLEGFKTHDLQIRSYRWKPETHYVMLLGNKSEVNNYMKLNLIWLIISKYITILRCSIPPSAMPLGTVFQNLTSLYIQTS